jgi:anti-anti-sigma factor
VTDLALLELAEREDGRIVARLTGEVDASNADRVLESLQRALTASALTIDLGRLKYLDSAGVRALYEVAETASARGVELAVVVPEGSPVRRVLTFSGVDGVLTVRPPAPGIG